MTDNTKQAEAEAKANAAAEAQAKADAEAAAAEAQAKASKPKKATKPLDSAKLRELIALVEEGNTRLQRASLIEMLAKDEKAKLVDTGSQHELTMAGVKASATDGEQGVLRNWCSAARRKCLSGEAE